MGLSTLVNELHLFLVGKGCLSSCSLLGYYLLQEGEQGKVPLLIIRPKSSSKTVKRPAIIALHGTNHSKETMRPLMEVWYLSLSMLDHNQVVAKKERQRLIDVGNKQLQHKLLQSLSNVP